MLITSLRPSSKGFVVHRFSLLAADLFIVVIKVIVFEYLKSQCRRYVDFGLRMGCVMQQYCLLNLL